MAASEGQEVQANQGSPDQLPQGAATTLNEAMPAEGQLDPYGDVSDLGLAPAPAPANYEDGDVSPEESFSPKSDEEEILFMDRDPYAPATVPMRPGRLPESLARMLPLMKAAAAVTGDPSGSLQLTYEALVNSEDASLRE